MSSSGQPGGDSVGGSAVRWRSALRDRSAELLVIAAVALAVLTQLTLTKFKDVIPYSSAGFVFAIGLLGAAAFAQTRRARAQVVFSQAPQTDIALPPRIEIALLAAVFVLAVFFRFWHLLSFPPGLWSDEAINASDAIALIDGDHTRIWFDSVFGRSTLYLYLLAGSMKIFGYTIFAIRIVPALAGLAAVVAFYPLARHLVGSVPAVVATALFAVSRWAVTFSRVSWEASVQPVLEILAIYFIVRGIDRMSRVSFALGGVALAAGLYGYIAFRMVPIFVALLLLYVAATQWRSLRSNAAGLLVFALAFLAAVAPLANFALHNQDRFLQRTRDVNVFREIDREGSYEPLRHNVHATLKMMNVRGDGNGRHNLPGAPMVDDVTAALFILGLGVSVWSLRDWRRGSLVIWLGLSLIPGALTLRIENPSAIRAIGALPPLYLLVGLGVAAVYRPLAATRNGLILFGALATALVGGSTALNYDELFRQQAHAKDVYDGFTPVYAGVGELIASKAGSHRVYVSQKFYSFNAVRVLTHGKRYDPYIAGNDVVFPRGDQDVLLILDDNELAVLETLRRLYPNLQHDDHVDPFGRLEYASVTIPVTDIDASHQLTLTQLASGGEPVVSRAPLDREWTADDLASGPIAAAWEGYIWVTTSGAEVPVDIRVPGTDATLAVDGDPAPLLSADGGNASLGVLPIGEHHIRISALIARPGRVKMRLSMEGPSMVAGADASDALYQESTGSAGFQVGFRAGRDFSGDPVATGRVPFAVPMPGIANAAAVEYRGILDVPALGTYGFALDGTSSSQIFVDDELLVDNGGGHPRRRVEATIDLSPGPHAVSIQYIAGAGQLDWSLHLRAPSRDWALATGSEFRVPEGAFRTTPSVIIAPSAGSWPSSVLRLAGLDIPTGIAVAPDGTVLVGGENKIVIIGADGAAQRTVPVDVRRIDDLDVTASGQIVVIDDAAGSLVLLDVNGLLVKRFDKVFSSAFGVGVRGETAYVAAPAGGIVYTVPLPDGPVTTLSITDPEAEGHPKQPSDVAVSAGGVFYIIDFERQNVVRSPDGATGRAFRGVGGTGSQVPHIAVYGSLVLLTDPVNQRIVVYDIAGKQRGSYLFPAGAGGTRPIGIAVAPDGTIYVADASGTVQRLKIEIPPATAADLPQPDGS